MKQQRKPMLCHKRIAAGLLAGFCVSGSHAEEKMLDTVTVKADAVDQSWIQPDRSGPNTVYQVGSEALRVFGNPGGANPYTAVAEIPGVKITSVDAYGLNNMQGGQKGMRVRGEVSTHGVAGTVEGLALGGPGPGPGYLFLFDRENLADISFAQGAVAADRPGLFNTYGALDSQLLWPSSEARREVSFSAGSNAFKRAFARVDTGDLPTGTTLFLSASDTSADKWRGFGKAPSARENAEIALRQTFGALAVKLIYASNDQAQNSYKALTYVQARDLDRFRSFDYANNPASSDHYAYNRQDFRNQVLLAELEYAFTPQTKAVFKPYLAQEEGYYLYAGSTSTQLQKWLIDHETYGFTGVLQTLLADTQLKFGYSWTSTDPPGPPTTRKQYSISPTGVVTFNGWSMLGKVVDRHEFQNLFATAQHRFGALTLQGGAHYAREILPGIDAYSVAGTSNASWDVSPEAALARATKNSARSVSSRGFGHWLPQIGLGYEFNPALEVHGSLGRNIGAPSFDAFNQTPAGQITTSQGYWDLIKTELSTSLDLGARLRYGQVTVDPTLYFSRTRDKAVSVYSATSNTIWSQNIGNTRARGLQVAAGWTPSDSLRVFGAYSYSRSYFAEDVLTTGGALLSVTGKQLPDVPRTMANLGLAWRSQGVTVAPMLQYVGPRWATTTYTEKMPGYFSADLNLAYTQKASWGDWEASLAVMNAFDRKYIGQISTSEVNTTANGAIYYPGAPRTLVAKLAFKF
jgi:iron complex outermembrane receptor protein